MPNHVKRKVWIAEISVHAKLVVFETHLLPFCRMEVVLCTLPVRKGILIHLRVRFYAQLWVRFSACILYIRVELRGFRTLVLFISYIKNSII